MTCPYVLTKWLHELFVFAQTFGHNDWTISLISLTSRAILSCLTDAVKAANEHVLSVRSRFSVGSEVPLQKIALRKYISKEMNTEVCLPCSFHHTDLL